MSDANGGGGSIVSLLTEALAGIAPLTGNAEYDVTNERFLMQWAELAMSKSVWKSQTLTSLAGRALAWGIGAIGDGEDVSVYAQSVLGIQGGRLEVAYTVDGFEGSLEDERQAIIDSLAGVTFLGAEKKQVFGEDEAGGMLGFDVQALARILKVEVAANGREHVCSIPVKDWNPFAYKGARPVNGNGWKAKKVASFLAVSKVAKEAGITKYLIART